MNIEPAQAQDRTRNPLRPSRFADVVGQEPAKYLMKRAIQSVFTLKQPLDHTLIVAPSGTGKSTFSHVIANELGVDCYDVEAPISFDTLRELRTQMYDGDILRIEEIHQQAIMERRGRDSATQPEVLYAVMEDRTLITDRGPLEYPRITIIGTTTDEGLLPDAFVNRFPLRPRLEPYTDEQLADIAAHNARTLGADMSPEAAAIFARASLGVPRQINNFVRNATMLAAGTGPVDSEVAREVLQINGVTEDGLTADMQAMLTFLYTRARQETAGGEVRYQASVSTIATAIGKSRDSKAIALRVEPPLIVRGLVQVTHGGRRLTDAGVLRALDLLADQVGVAA